MTGNEIREIFLKYFERQGHRRVASSPLLPTNDPTLLFANAGMNQFKDTFLGAEERDYARATSSQKCLRAGGKHNDLDDVGDNTHHTFFEMLGNFSFGDYFKRDAIRYALELLLNEYGMPLERLWFTVYETDDEAAELWVEAGVPAERVLRFGAKDNFWQMGDTGPCGPCSEIHFYTGPDPHDSAKNSATHVNRDGSPTVEIWNLVFMQYDRDESGELTPLPKPSVDTGAGLERVTAVLQGAKDNYETDLLRPIVDKVAQLSDRPYEPETREGFAMRVITDHARAAAFAIADNILPGNDGRNYVLRKIMRRAIYHGRHVLGLEDTFFHRVTDFVVDQFREAFPELEGARDFIDRMVSMEERRFASTLTTGLQKLDALFAATPAGEMPDYKELAKLYDTFGTPRDLVRVSLEERGFRVGEETFNEQFDAALRELQRGGAKEQAAAQTARAKPVYGRVAERAGQCRFTGYEETRTEGALVVALISGDDEVEELAEGEAGEIVLDRSPFYAESGGQVGDTGHLLGVFETPATDNGSPVKHDVRAAVNDTPPAPAPGLIVHSVTVERGHLRVGQMLTAVVDTEKRDATRRNHTATHLMHAALREVLGTHVKQAGSVVAPNYLRFDFTHFQPLSREEVAEIERLVNYHVLRNERVQTDVLALEEAMQTGAMALFGEKYAERVRVLSIPGAEGVFSKELCGGTHVRATGDIGLFKITGDESVASGTRRIRAVTGADALTRFQETEALVDNVSSELRSTRGDIPAAVARLQEELKKARREADDLRLKLALGAGAGASATSDGRERREVAGGVAVLAREASDLDAAALRQLSDTLLGQLKSGVVVLGRRADGKASLIVRTSDDLVKRVPAGQVIRELAPIIGGRGGGRPDMAEGGGAEPQKLAEALEASYAIVERLLGAQGAAAS
jgi:alanyl-tRNA synthetase